jgi:hypothetical protein
VALKERLADEEDGCVRKEIEAATLTICRKSYGLGRF